MILSTEQIPFLAYGSVLVLAAVILILMAKGFPVPVKASEKTDLHRFVAVSDNTLLHGLPLVRS
jgi:hypothetical protein